jgi:hypothetical protein
MTSPSFTRRDFNLAKDEPGSHGSAWFCCGRMGSPVLKVVHVNDSEILLPGKVPPAYVSNDSQNAPKRPRMDLFHCFVVEVFALCFWALEVVSKGDCSLI